MTRLILIVALALPLTAVAQNKPAPPPSVSTVEAASYPFPLEERDKIRDLQHEYDQIEIENQRMLLKVEQNKSRQSTLIDAMKANAFKFAESKKINLDLYELDPTQIAFIRKKKP